MGKPIILFYYRLFIKLKKGHIFNLSCHTMCWLFLKTVYENQVPVYCYNNMSCRL